MVLLELRSEYRQPLAKTKGFIFLDDVWHACCNMVFSEVVRSSL